MLPVALPRARRSLRRALRFDCEVVADRYEGTVIHQVHDMSTHGAFLESALPLDPGDEVILSLRPPRYPLRTAMTIVAEVARVWLPRRRHDPGPAGMGIKFREMDYDELLALEHALRGVPPPLPRPPREVLAFDGDELEITALGALLC
jgi:hypothetical protein